MYYYLVKLEKEICVRWIRLNFWLNWYHNIEVHQNGNVSLDVALLLERHSNIDYYLFWLPGHSCQQKLLQFKPSIL